VVIIATGLPKHRWLSNEVLIAEKQRHFIQGVDLIESQNKILDGLAEREHTSGKHNMQGKRVAIVGGGDTAWDDVGICIRQGAQKIAMLVRGDKARNLSQEQINKILDGSYEGSYDFLDKELRSNIEEARALAVERG